MTRADRPTTLRAAAVPGNARHRLVVWLAVPFIAAALLLGVGDTGSADPLGDGSGAAAEQGVLPVPTAEELAAQSAEAERLAAEVVNHEVALEAARKAIDEMAQGAAEALEAEQAALAAEAAAVEEQNRQLDRLDAAEQLVLTRQGELGRWASQTYRNGGHMGDIEGLMNLLGSENTDDLSQRMATINLVGRWRGSVVDTVEEAEAVQEDATARAEEATEQATAAAAQAVAARELADSLLLQQRGQVALMQALLDTTEQAATEANNETEKMALARAEAEQRRLDARSSSRSGGNAVTGEVGDCVGGDVSSYPNGAIPRENLCPLWATRDHRLRADAAFGFNRMSEAYALRFGAPICVTDSYRDYAGQVRLYATKPNLAAKPGTSNHGWGTATDLCGGIQTFGTAQHQWMRAKAPLFGFFHPSWAQQGGSRPEAWHWEYGG